MPTYEYECTSCGTVQDVFHSMTKKPRVKCLKCGGRTKKLIGAGAGIIFKGSGFYETDYKRKSGPTGGGNGKGNGRPAAPKEKPAESKKSETKTEGSAKPDKD